LGEHELVRLEAYANLRGTEIECVDFVLGLSGEQRRAACSYLRVLDGAGVEDLTAEHVETLRRVVAYS